MAIKAPKLSAEDLVHLADQKQLIVALEPRKSLPVLVSTCTQCMCLVYNFIKIITYVWEKENYFESTKRLFCVHESHHKKNYIGGPSCVSLLGGGWNRLFISCPPRKKRKMNNIALLYWIRWNVFSSLHASSQRAYILPSTWGYQLLFVCAWSYRKSHNFFFVSSPRIVSPHFITSQNSQLKQLILEGGNWKTHTAEEFLFAKVNEARKLKTSAKCLTNCIDIQSKNTYLWIDLNSPSISFWNHQTTLWWLQDKLQWLHSK